MRGRAAERRERVPVQSLTDEDLRSSRLDRALRYPSPQRSSRRGTLNPCSAQEPRLSGCRGGTAHRCGCQDPAFGQAASAGCMSTCAASAGASSGGTAIRQGQRMDPSLLPCHARPSRATSTVVA